MVATVVVRDEVREDVDIPCRFTVSGHVSLHERSQGLVEPLYNCHPVVVCCGEGEFNAKVIRQFLELATCKL